jgi:hypothetical protein
MKIHITKAIESLEDSVIRNKWFTLAAVSLVLLGGGLFYTMHEQKEGIAECFRTASDIAYGSPRHVGEIKTPWGEKLNASVASGDLARAYFGMCLVVNGVDTRGVPPFEDLFPQMTVSQNFQNESFDVVDSGIFEENEFLDDHSQDEEPVE